MDNVKEYFSNERFVTESSMVGAHFLDFELSRTGARRLIILLEEALEERKRGVRVSFVNESELYISFKDLDVDELSELNPGEIIAQGITTDDEKGINLDNTGNKVKWIAVRGDIADWAIYVDNPHTPKQTFDEVRRTGDKVNFDVHIEKLVPCTPAALGAYRR